VLLVLLLLLLLLLLLWGGRGLVMAEVGRGMLQVLVMMRPAGRHWGEGRRRGGRSP
jgi:hypothetical protein